MMKNNQYDVAVAHEFFIVADVTNAKCEDTVCWLYALMQVLLYWNNKFFRKKRTMVGNKYSLNLKSLIVNLSSAWLVFPYSKIFP